MNNHIYHFEIACITAFRKKLTNITDNTIIDIKEGSEYKREENIRRNRDMKAALLSLGYGVTRISEDNKDEVQEQSFLVVNLNEDSNFKTNLFILSEMFNQDSFLYSPKNSTEGYLIGTNYSNYPGYEKEEYIENFSEKVNINKNINISSLETFENCQNNSKFLIHKYSNEIISKLNLIKNP